MTDKHKPYDAWQLVGNIEEVLESCDIGRLKKPAYKFITLHMGFIAHYDLYGFQDHYADLRTFCWKLQTSEYATDEDHTLNRADQYETDAFYHKQYGQAYVKSITQTIRGIVAVVRRLEPSVNEVFDRFEKMQRLTNAQETLDQYGITSPAQLKAELDKLSASAR